MPATIAHRLPTGMAPGQPAHAIAAGVQGMRRPVPRAPVHAAIAQARSALPAGAVRGLVRLWGHGAPAEQGPDDRLRSLFAVGDDPASLIDRPAAPYDGGSQVKHRLTSYHDFFVDRVRPDERGLDISSGLGQLAADIVHPTRAQVTGIDFNPDHVAIALNERGETGVAFVEADALTWSAAFAKRCTRPRST